MALQMLKQNVARQLREPEGGAFWQPRYYDFCVWSEAKRIEKLRLCIAIRLRKHESPKSHSGL